jgi:hypothetical protein
MNITTVACACLLCAAGAMSQNNPGPVIACDLKAIPAADRPRYNDLIKRVRSAVRDRSELTCGYAYKLAGNLITLSEVAEWIAMERRCCPFLQLQLAVSGSQSDWVLTLTGPAGVKPLLQAEFPAPVEPYRG